MSKRDEVARIVCSGLAPGTCPHICEGCETDADAILALLSDPDDRMVEAAQADLAESGWLIPLNALRAAIRAAMKAAGE